VSNEQWRVDPRWTDDEYAAHLAEHGTAAAMADALVAWRRVLYTNNLIEHPAAARRRIAALRDRRANPRRPDAAPPTP
jgi:hypothetical protein